VEPVWDLVLVTIGCKIVGGGRGLGLVVVEMVQVWEWVSIGCIRLNGGIGLGGEDIGSLVRGVMAGELLEVAVVEGKLGDNCGDGEECVGGEDEAKTDDLEIEVLFGTKWELVEPILVEKGEGRGRRIIGSVKEESSAALILEGK
jgi:hypothetical protein